MSRYWRDVGDVGGGLGARDLVSREQKEVPGVTPRFLTLASPRREDAKFHCGPAATERTEA